MVIRHPRVTLPKVILRKAINPRVTLQKATPRVISLAIRLSNKCISNSRSINSNRTTTEALHLLKDVSLHSAVVVCATFSSRERSRQSYMGFPFDIKPRRLKAIEGLQGGDKLLCNLGPTNCIRFVDYLGPKKRD